jgi:internalin A
VIFDYVDDFSLECQGIAAWLASSSCGARPDGKDRIKVGWKELGSCGGLVVTRRELVSIPCNLSRLVCLAKASFASNQLTSLPDSLATLPMLRELDLSGNKFRDIPSCVFRIARLAKLWLARNQISKVPSDVKGLAGGLELLDLSRNKITSLPMEMSSLRRLKKLNLIHNLLDSLPKKQLEGLPLEELLLDDRLFL